MSPKLAVHVLNPEFFRPAVLKLSMHTKQKTSLSSLLLEESVLATRPFFFPTAYLPAAFRFPEPKRPSYECIVTLSYWHRSLCI